MPIFTRLSGLTFLLLLTATLSRGQLTLTGTSYTQNFDGLPTLPTGWTVRTGATTGALGTTTTIATDTWAGTSGNFRNVAAAEAPLVAGSSTTTQNSAADRALGIRQSGSFGDPGAAFVLQLANTANRSNFSLTLKHMIFDAQPRTTDYTVEYTTVAAGNSGWTSLGTFSTSGSWGATSATYSFGTALNNIAGNVWIRVRADGASSGSGNRDTYGIDDFVLSWTNAGSPTLTVTPTALSGFYYVQGSGPSGNQSFNVSGSNLTANINLTAPGNYEIATSAGGTYGASLSLTPSGGTVASTPIYVRLKAGLTAGTYNGQTVTAASTGATSVTVTCNGTVYKPEPANQPTGFACAGSTQTGINLSWTDATGGTLPDGYLIKWSTVSYAAITDPTDGSTANGSNSATVTQGTETANITGLSIGTTYYFKIYSYSNSGTFINYKTTAALQTTCDTQTAPWEDFEPGSKTGYADGNVTCTAGSWAFIDALLGTSGSDYRTGSQSARIRDNIAMNFDLTTGLGTVTLNHGMYGSDANANWRLEASTDNGATWNAFVSPTYTATSSTFAIQTITVNLAGNVRFRIVKLTGGTGTRLNIDDIYVTPFNAPEINIKQASTSVPSGGSSNFGSVCETGAPLLRTFTIENTGSLPLVLTDASPYVTLSGSGDFSLTAPASSPIAAGGSSSFTISFDPSSPGAKTATLSIANNDDDENPYTITLQGTGTAAVTPAVSISASPAGAVCAGTSVSFSATPSNSGGGSAGYEWFVNSVSQGTGNPYVSSTLNTSDAVQAVLTVTGGSCIHATSASSNTITVTVNPVPGTPAGNISPSANPACGNSVLTYDSPSASVYWQTTANGTSTALPSTSPYTATNSGTYYVRGYNGSCWSTALASVPVTVTPVVTVSIAPTATQNLLTGVNGTTLNATETGATGREWFYGTVAGGPYTTSTGNTSTSYAPNFATNGTYYIVCRSTNSCGSVTSNAVQINVTPLQPPVITHASPLGNTSSTSARTANAVISSQAALTGAPMLYYRVDGSSWIAVTGTLVSGSLGSGATYSFTIPGQPTGSWVEYYFSASNAAGTTRLPENTDDELPQIVNYGYQIDCGAPVSGTKTIAFQGFEFVSSPSWTFSVSNATANPTVGQNYEAHPAAVEWRYYNQGANGSVNATNRNSCACMAETYSGLPTCPDGGMITAGSSTGLCATYGSQVRGVYTNNSATTENPTGARVRNGGYSYQQLSQSGSATSYSMIYLDDVAIPDAALATNIRVVVYVASISVGSMTNGAESDDKVDLMVSYNSSGNVNQMVTDLSCGSSWYFAPSNAFAQSAGTTNAIWDYAGNTYNSSGGAVGTTTKNKLTINVPAGTTNVRAMIRILNDAGGNELWGVDDIQIIADYPAVSPVAKRYYRSRNSGSWHNASTWERAQDPAFTVGLENACTVPDFANSDTIIIRNGHTVNISVRDTVDQLRVETGGKLVYNTGGLFLNDHPNGADLYVEGTFVDNADASAAIRFLNTAEWQIGANATVTKTNTSPVSDYRDRYRNGIADIPATANWIYRYIGIGSPVTLAENMYYPNLFFENKTGSPYTWSNANTALTGAAGYATVKGNFSVGITGTAPLTLLNNNIHTQPMLVLGNLNVGAGSALYNTSYNGLSDAVHGYGTGYEVRGNVNADGDINLLEGSGERIFKLSGGNLQTVSGTGRIDLYKLSIDKSARYVSLQRNLHAQNELQMKAGDIHTGSNTLELGLSVTQTGSLDYTAGHVVGILKRWFAAQTNTGNVSGLYPIGVAGNDRFATVEYGSAPGTGGSLTTRFVSTAMGNAGLPLPVIAAGSCAAFNVENTNSEGYWQIDAGDGLAGGSYDITLVGENLSDINDLCKITAIKRVGGGNWFQSGTHLAASGTLARPVVKRSAASGWSNWGFGGGNINPLPVKLAAFNGTCEGHTVNLGWITASELNSERFVVEKSRDLQSFEYVLSVTAAGSSNEMHSYQVQVPRSEALTYFRLRQEDFNGAYEYFGPLSVSCANEGARWNVYTYGQLLFINAQDVEPGTYTFRLHDPNGKCLHSFTRTLGGSSDLTEDLAQLPAGIYFVSRQSAKETHTQKIILTR